MVNHKSNLGFLGFLSKQFLSIFEEFVEGNICPLGWGTTSRSSRCQNIYIYIYIYVYINRRPRPILGPNLIPGPNLILGINVIPRLNLIPGSTTFLFVAIWV